MSASPAPVPEAPLRFKAIVFDFDGTLVQSAAAKRQAFFGLFQPTPAHAAIIERVLVDNPEGTRFTLVPQMIEAVATAGLALPDDTSPERLLATYGKVAFAAVTGAPELPGATALLRHLSRRAILTICSSTPDEPLKELVAARGWTPLLDGVFGLPVTKTAHIAGLMAQDGLAPAEVAMIGDGDNDAAAAAANGCTFFRIEAPEALMRVAAELGAGDVQE